MRGASAWLDCHQGKMGRGKKAVAHNGEDSAEREGDIGDRLDGQESSKPFKINRQL